MQFRFLVWTLPALALASLACSSPEPKVELTLAQRADTMTNALFDILREQLTSPKPMREEQRFWCEAERLHDVVGIDSAEKLFAIAEARLNEVATSSERQAIADAVALKQVIAGYGCDSLAAAGRLGGPWVGRVVKRSPLDNYDIIDGEVIFRKK